MTPERTPSEKCLGLQPLYGEHDPNGHGAQGQLVDAYPEGVDIDAGGVAVYDKLVEDIYHAQEGGEQEG